MNKAELNSGGGRLLRRQQDRSSQGPQRRGAKPSPTRPQLGEKVSITGFRRFREEGASFRTHGAQPTYGRAQARHRPQPSRAFRAGSDLRRPTSPGRPKVPRAAAKKATAGSAAAAKTAPAATEDGGRGSGQEGHDDGQEDRRRQALAPELGTGTTTARPTQAPGQLASTECEALACPLAWRRLRRRGPSWPAGRSRRPEAVTASCSPSALRLVASR